MESSITSGFDEFIEYVKSGNIDGVKETFKLEYLEKEAELRTRPFHIACKNGHVEVVKLLLQHKCNYKTSGACLWRPLHIACLKGHVEVVQLLLQRNCDIEASGSLGSRPLHLACLKGHVEVVQLLLQHKCDYEASGALGWRPLHLVCRYGHAEVAKILIQHKCDIEASDALGSRPLHLACLNGHVEVVKLLLQRNCDIEASGSLGWQPLHIACDNGHVEVFKLLLQANCNFKDCYDSLINIAKEAKSQEIIELLSAWRENKSMCRIAWAMSLECESGCSHRSCFISMSVEELKKKGDLIGGGAQGEVYKCSRPERSFALKIIKIDDETKNIEKNIEEYRNILKHDNIVQYFGSILESRHMAIFMEYITGESLHDRIKQNGAINHDTVAIYSRQILLGISFLHHKKIIHRDIKPQNILLDSAGQSLKLCDFGLSRSLMTISTITTQNANTVCGTPNYLAPEIIKGEPYSFPMDIWALGATIVEMLTGHPPFHKVNQFALILKISQLSTIEFTPVEPMSDNLKSFVNQMLQCEPSKRTTAKQLLDSKFINPISLNDN